MAYNSVSIKPYTKSHLEQQREITLIELAPNPYFFVLSICLAYMNMFARFDENPAMTFQDIKETKCYGRTLGQTDASTDGQRENSIPTTNKVEDPIRIQRVNCLYTPINLAMADGCQ